MKNYPIRLKIMYAKDNWTWNECCPELKIRKLTLDTILENILQRDSDDTLISVACKRENGPDFS